MGAAKFPVHRSLASFDFSQSKMDRTLIDQLADLSFTEAAHNLVLVGGTGTGKTHLASALESGGHPAARQTRALLFNDRIGQRLGSWRRPQANKANSPSV